MKLRQKLAAVMATAMVVTAVPVVTMADTTNAVRNVNSVLKNSEMGYVITKDNSTTTMAVLDATGATQVVTGATYVTLNKSTNSNYAERYIPAFEFVPKATYETGAQKQTFFISLSKDTTFNDEAFLTAINAVSSSTTRSGANGVYTSYATFENAPITAKPLVFEDGKVVQSNIAAWYGKTVDQIMATNPTLTIEYATTSANAPAAATRTLTISRISDLNVTENEKTYKSSIRVDVQGEWTTSDVVKVPLLAKAGGDEVIVRVDGLDSFVSSGTYVITGQLTDKRLTVTADSETLTVDGGEVGKITLSEAQLNSLTNSDNKYIEISLPTSSDLEFVASSQGASSPVTVTLTGARGFYGKKDTANVYYAKESRNSSQDDTKTVIIEIEDWFDATARGNVEITGLKVQPEGKVATAGEVNVTVKEFVGRLANGTEVKSDKLMDATTVKVADIKEYDVTFACEPVSIKAGRSSVVSKTYTTFTLAESVKDSLVDSRKVEFTLDNGYFFGPADINSNQVSYTSAAYKKEAKDYFNKLITDKVIKLEEKAEGAVINDVEINAAGQVIGFTATFPKCTTAKADKLKFTMPVAAQLEAKGEVKVTVSTRAFEKDIVGVVANIVEPIKVTIEQAAVKVGLQSQATGAMTIEETDKNMFEKGWLFVSVADEENITLNKVPTVKAEGVTIGEVAISKDKKVLAIEIKRTSTEAGKIVITDMIIDTDRTVAEGSYDAEIWGSALTDENVLDVTSYFTNVLNTTSTKHQISDTYTVKEFVKVTTPNTEDIKNGALKAVTSAFTLDSTKYTVDGVEYTMDAQAYEEDGRIMVPVRYIAQAFGIAESNVLYANQVATIIAGEKVIQVRMGSNILTVNGSQIEMDTKAVVKEGRAYVPMKFIAAALGVNVSWDNTTKTATFSNKN